MRKYKYMMAQFTFYDRTGIQKMLEKQAEKGWLLDKITNFYWRFRRVEPQKLHFVVTYFPKATAFDPGPSEQQLRLQEFCEYAGWIQAGAASQMQIFYHTAEDPVPIETDAALELENIESSAKKNFLPTYFILLANALVQAVMWIVRLCDDFTDTVSSNLNLFNGISWTVLLIMGAVELGGYYSWRKKARAAVETDGSFVPTRGFRGIQVAMFWVLMAALVGVLLTIERKIAVTMVIIMGLLFLMLLMIQALTAILKKLKIYAQTNKKVTMITTVVLSLILVSVIIYPVFERADKWFPAENVSEYEYNGHTFTSYNDELPLTVQDLVETDCKNYSYYLRESSSLVLGKYSASQSPHVGELDAPSLQYTVVDVKLPLLYNACLKDMLHMFDGWYGEDEDGDAVLVEFREESPEWGADRVFRKYWGDTEQEGLLLCYEERIIYIVFDWGPTAEQIRIVAEKLAN